MAPTNSASDCPFCAIVRSEAAAIVVAANSRCLAFFPDEPATLGHTLIIPRAHVRNLWSIADYELSAALMTMAIRIGKALDAVVTPEGMNLITSAGAAAEQTVFHLHLHVVPRWTNDRIGPIWPEGGLSLGPEAGELAQVLQKAYDLQE